MPLSRSICLIAVFLQMAVLSWAQQAPVRQSSSSPSSSAKYARKPVAADSMPSLGSVSNGMYRNKTFGFGLKIPVGWVLRTDEMNARETGKQQVDQAEEAQNGRDPGSPGHSDPNSQSSSDTLHGAVLLAAFSRPPEATGADVNSSIVIAAESTATYPGLKEAAQYFGPLTEVATAQGFKVVIEPYEFAVGGKLMVRGDFEKDRGTRAMHQTTLAMLAHGYAVSVTFIGGTNEEIEELIGNLSFVVARTPR